MTLDLKKHSLRHEFAVIFAPMPVRGLTDIVAGFQKMAEQRLYFDSACSCQGGRTAFHIVGYGEKLRDDELDVDEDDEEDEE